MNDNSNKPDAENSSNMNRSMWRRPEFYIASLVALIAGFIGGNYLGRYQLIMARQHLAETRSETSNIKKKYEALLKEHNAFVAGREAENKRVDSLLQNLEDTISKKDSQIKTLSEGFEKLSNEYGIQKEHLEGCLENYVQQGKDLAFVGSEAQRLQGELSDARDRAEKESAQISTLEQRLKDSEVNLHSAKQQLEAYRQESIRSGKESTGKIRKLEAQVEGLDNFYDNLEQDYNDSMANLKKATAIIDRLTARVKNLEAGKKKAKSEYDEKIAAADERYAGCMKKNAELENEIQELYKKHDKGEGMVNIRTVEIQQDSCLWRGIKGMLEHETHRKWNDQRHPDNSSTPDGIYIWKKVNEIRSNYPEQPAGSMERLGNLDLVYAGDTFNVYIGDMPKK